MSSAAPKLKPIEEVLPLEARLLRAMSDVGMFVVELKLDPEQALQSAARSYAVERGEVAVRVWCREVHRQRALAALENPEPDDE